MLFIIHNSLICRHLQAVFMGFDKMGFCPRLKYNIEKALTASLVFAKNLALYYTHGTYKKATL